MQRKPHADNTSGPSLQMKPHLIRAVACRIALVTLVTFGAHGQNTLPDLTTLQLEDLMNLDVTSAAKKQQKLSNVPAAIFVIRREDIRRSGATSTPDLLRIVPGLEVAEINPSTWAITARGFNGQYSNKVLVLVDGRSVYTPIFGGVFWDELATPLDLVERIEVIRGPGAAIWGANAVNGIINIITRRAADTQGVAVVLQGGTHEHGFGMGRYGKCIGSHAWYRLHIDGLETGNNRTYDRPDAHDGWRRFHGGFRVDDDLTKHDALTLQGQVNRGSEGELATTIVSLTPPVTSELGLKNIFFDWSLLGRWKHDRPTGSSTSLQMYFDRFTRTDTTVGGGQNTLDLDFQQRLFHRRHDLVWGLGYRYTSDQLPDLWRIAFHPETLGASIFNSFLQDDITVVRNRLHIVLGTKLEHEYYNGWNLQPTVRAAWTPGERATLWSAVSYAERTPTRTETEIRWNTAVYPGPDQVPVLISLFGSPTQQNEHLTATEAGVRKQFSDRVTFDGSAFFNRYTQIASIEQGPPRLETDPSPLHILLPFTFANQLHGETHGLELFAQVKLANRWTLSPGYTFLAMHLHPLAPASGAVAGPTTTFYTVGNAPSQQAQLRSTIVLPRQWQWGVTGYFVGRLPSPALPSYICLDSQLTWRPSKHVALMLVGQNLLRNAHQEYADPELTVTPSLVLRSGFVRLMWRY